MKFLKKDLTAASSGEQIKSAVPCTFRNHATAVKSAATVKYTDANGIEKTFFALNASLDPLFDTADQYDDDVIVACLVTAGYRSGRDLSELENSVKTAESAAAPLEKRDGDLRKQAAACGDQEAKHAAIMAEIDKNGPALAAARDALNGWDPSGGCLYYYNPRATDDQWIRTRTVKTVIGNHQFAV